MKRRWIRWSLLALAVLALLALLAPALAGTGFVRDRVERWAAARTGLDVKIGSLSAGWWSGFEIHDLRARVPEGEFAGSEVMAVDRAVFEPGLAGLLAGPDALDVEVVGLVVTVEERAGGRTSLDRLLERHLPRAAPTPVEAPPPPAERVAPAPALHVRLVRSRVEVRRLPYRPPTDRINPFERDVPIRGVDEGVEVYRLDAARLDLTSDAGVVAVSGEVTAAHGDERATLQADLRIEGGTADGEVFVTGFDLALLEPIVRTRLAGRVDMRASGSFAPGRSHGTMQLDLTGLATDEFSEKWIKGRLEFSGRDDTLAIETIELTSESGRFAARGAIDIPRDEPSRPSGTLAGTFPLAPIYQMAARKQPPATAQIHFDIKTDLSATGGRLEGRISLDDLTLEKKPDEVTLRFALRGERATRRLQIESFALRSDFARADLEGAIVRPPHFAADLTGSASGDLARLARIAAHFDAALETDGVAGRGAVRIRTLRAVGGSDLDLEADASVEGLRLRGGEPVDLRGSFAGSFHDRFDRVVVRSVEVRDLRGKGTFQGLRSRGPPVGEAELSGTLSLTPRLFDFLGIHAIDAPRGQARAEIRIRSDGSNVAGEGKVDATDIAFRIDDFEHSEPTLEATFDLAFDGERLTGKCALESASLKATLEALRFDVEKRTLQSPATIDLSDAALLAPLLGEERFEWTGRHSARVSLAAGPGELSIRGKIDAPRLRLRYGDHGLDGEPAALSGTARYSDHRWDLAGLQLVLPGRRLEAVARKLAFGPEGPQVEVGVHAPLESFPRYAPELAGILDARVGRKADGTWELAASVAELLRRGESFGRVSATATGVALGSPVRMPRVELRTKSGVAKVEAEFGDAIRVRFDASGEDFGEIAALLPRCAGSGRFSCGGSVVVGEDRRVAVQGKGSVAIVEVGQDRLEGLSFEVEGSFRRTAGALDDLRTKGLLRADAARAGPVKWRNAEITISDGRGTIRSDGGGPGHRLRFEARAERIGLPDRDFSDVRIDGNAILRRPRIDVDDALEVDATLRFERIPAAVLDWRDGAAKISLKDRVIVVRDLRATANGGKLTGGARADLRRGVVPWSVELNVERAKLTAGFTDPLSYVLPILRLSGKDEAATGFVDAKVKLSAAGTRWDEVRRTLEGGGRLHLADAEIKGSLLMPLLSLRLGRLLLNKPYRIPDDTIDWKVENGVVKTDPLKLNGLPFHISLGGSVTLDGELDYIVHPGILLVPLKVTGSWGKVRVRPAPAEALPNWPWKK